MIPSGADGTRRPFFLERGGRRLFCLLHSPVAMPPRGGVVFFAPFAEEMNRSRRMTALLGEALAAAGFATLVFDYSGTGDSGGDFAEARWDDWIEDGRAALDWLAGEIGTPVTPVALRLGAAVALAAAGRDAPPPARMMLWQPVASGSVSLTRFLRIRVAAALASEDGETTGALRERLAAGETVEVAGYALTPPLAEAIDAISLSGLTPPPDVAVDWLEVANADDASLAPASTTVIGRWRDAGVGVSEGTVAGEPFWSIQETATAPALVAETVRRLGAGAG